MLCSAEGIPHHFSLCAQLSHTILRSARLLDLLANISSHPDFVQSCLGETWPVVFADMGQFF